MEAELRKLHPEGGKIQDVDVSSAVLALNSKLRRKLSIAGYEMHTAWNMDTGDNINLDDKTLRESQISARRHQTNPSDSISIPKPGDTVTNILPQPKHTARNMYLVTASSPEAVSAQKILHPLSDGSTKFGSKTYISHPKHLRIINQPAGASLPGE